MRHALHDRLVASAGGTEILLPGMKNIRFWIFGTLD